METNDKTPVELAQVSTEKQPDRALEQEFLAMVGKAYFEGEGKEKKEALKALYGQMQAAKLNGTFPPDDYDFATVVWDLDDPTDE